MQAGAAAMHPVHVTSAKTRAGSGLGARRCSRRGSTVDRYLLELGRTMQYRRISADCHLDMPWMPPDLFVSEAPCELKDRMPYVAEGSDGLQWVAKNGATFGLLYGVGPGGAKHVPGQNLRVDIMAERGLYKDAKEGRIRCSDPHLRLKDMEADGVDAEVIYGVLGTASKLNDTEASNEVLHIYNDWLKDFCGHYPDRQIGLACLPYGSVERAVKEVRRVAKMGLKGLELSCSWDMEPMWHPSWEPFWQAVDEVQLPLHFHTFPTTPPRARQETPNVRRAAMFTGVIRSRDSFWDRPSPAWCRSGYRIRGRTKGVLDPS